VSSVENQAEFALSVAPQWSSRIVAIPSAMYIPQLPPGRGADSVAFPVKTSV
jgi:hypothetical protein